MSSLNACFFIGNLGRDPETRLTQTGKKIVSISVAVSKRWKDRHTGESKEDTYWARCAIMADGLSDVAEKYLKKGSKVLVGGEMRRRKWTDKDGIERYSDELIVGPFGGKLVLLDKAEGGGSGVMDTAADLDDEIPF